jgi:hypothetical protein
MEFIFHIDRDPQPQFQNAQDTAYWWLSDCGMYKIAVYWVTEGARKPYRVYYAFERFSTGENFGNHTARSGREGYHTLAEAKQSCAKHSGQRKAA